MQNADDRLSWVGKGAVQSGVEWISSTTQSSAPFLAQTDCLSSWTERRCRRADGQTSRRRPELAPERLERIAVVRVFTFRLLLPFSLMMDVPPIGQQEVMCVSFQ